jgi:hypothetical protein
MFFSPNSDHDFPAHWKNQYLVEIECKLQHHVAREALMRAKPSVVRQHFGIPKLCSLIRTSK